MKRTPWYPAHIKPVRVGWYEVRWADHPHDVMRRYWSGRGWCLTASGDWPHRLINHEWRGLTAPHGESK